MRRGRRWPGWQVCRDSVRSHRLWECSVDKRWERCVTCPAPPPAPCSSSAGCRQHEQRSRSLYSKLSVWAAVLPLGTDLDSTHDVGVVVEEPEELIQAPQATSAEGKDGPERNLMKSLKGKYYNIQILQWKKQIIYLCKPGQINLKADSNQINFWTLDLD